MIAPSILSADFSRLGELVREVETAGASRIHVDVMDGHFVPNLSMGAIVVQGLRPVTKIPLEVHLMVEDPGRFLDGFIKAGSDTIIVHLEVLPDPRPMIEQIRGLGKKVGLAFNPDMAVEKIEPYLRDIDLALCMTVFPGFGGQAFIVESLDRLKKLRAMVEKHNPACEIEVDGGINAKTIAAAAGAGAGVFVAGNAVFLAKGGPAAGVKELAALAKGEVTAMTRADAFALLCEYVSDISLRRHCMSVEAAMRAYAQKLGHGEETWGIVGLLHDFDYERWNTAPDHPLKGSEILRERGYSEEVIACILSHADYLSDRYPRRTPMEKGLYACDEITGLVTATALLRPTGIGNLTASSVKKKMKAKGFAKGVNRDDVIRGAADFGVELDAHIQFVIDAMKTVAAELGLEKGSGVAGGNE